MTQGREDGGGEMTEDASQDNDQNKTERQDENVDEQELALEWRIKRLKER